MLALSQYIRHRHTEPNIQCEQQWSRNGSNTRNNIIKVYYWASSQLRI